MIRPSKITLSIAAAVMIVVFMLFASYDSLRNSPSGLISPYKSPASVSADPVVAPVIGGAGVGVGVRPPEGMLEAPVVKLSQKEKEEVEEDGVVNGGVIMPKLGNETIKAELGRASWKLFHTMLARFPESPTLDERTALSTYLHLFSRLYPCGDCATHFQSILALYPPQTSSRETASQWGCFVHNLVNERLGKDMFDCLSIAERYKCGCDEEEGGEAERKGEALTGGTATVKQEETGEAVKDTETETEKEEVKEVQTEEPVVKSEQQEAKEHLENMEVETEGLTAGG